MMAAVEVKPQTRTQKGGWVIVLVVSVLLLLHGAFWGLAGAEVALESIAERTTLPTSEFQVGSPSAYDVIGLTERNFSIMEAALGLIGVLMAWAGFRSGLSLAWMASAILVAGLAAMAINFVAVGGLGGASIGFLAIALLAMAGLFLARLR